MVIESPKRFDTHRQFSSFGHFGAIQMGLIWVDFRSWAIYHLIWMSELDLVLLHAPSNYDFRQRSIFYGPISDVIPPAPVFEMYPIGFVSLGAYLERHGLRCRVVNIASRMLRSPSFDAEEFIAKLRSRVFGIDLHWLPHAHGSLELARIVKRHHPDSKVVFGGLSATYFREELIQYPQVDFVIRGDSAEVPLLELLTRLKKGLPIEEVPNLSWKDDAGVPHHNPLSLVPSSLDDFPLDYDYPTRLVIRHRDLLSILPFRNWLSYPITMALTCRGCTHNCVTCGGSAYAFRRFYRRDKPAYRSPKLLVQDIRSVQKYLRGPVFIIGDIRQPGEEYAEELLGELRAQRIRVPLVLELFSPAGKEFFDQVRKAAPQFNIQFSIESHDEGVRQAFGKGYPNQEVEKTVEEALKAGCKRFDLFFMIGLPRQDFSLAVETATYCRGLLRELDPERRLHPQISPLAPFLDPGSQAFEEPEKFGYKLLFRSLEEHRRALLEPSWKYMLNYETRWLNRDELVAATYEAALKFNELKLEHGLLSSQTAHSVESRIRESLNLVNQVDRLAKGGQQLNLRKLERSTICEKKELEWPALPLWLNLSGVLRALFSR